MATEYSNLCQCGCGAPAPIAKRTDRNSGYVKGQQLRFVRGHGRKVGRKDTNSYYTDRVPGHPRASGPNNSVLRHVLIAEKAIGRTLPDGVEVHHVDENKQNNKNGNLVICQDRHYHALLHRRAKVVRNGGNPDTQRFCRLCQTVKDLDQFPTDNSIADGHRSYCKGCASVSRRRYYYRNTESAYAN